MNQPLFSSGGIAKYHQGMLLVKVRPTIEAVAPPGPASFASSVVDSPGLAVLEMVERAGRIKRVTPISISADTDRPAVGPRMAVAAMAAAPQAADDVDPTTGMSLVELEDDRDLGELHTALARDPHIEAVNRVPVRYLVAKKTRRRAKPKRRAGGATIAATPPPASTMWNLRRIQWEQARALSGFQEANEIDVAVLDTGIQPDHPDLDGQVASYTYHHPDLPQPSGSKDIIGHGTHVAGTIGALINDAIGINGVCDCRLHAWKIFDDQTTYSPGSDEFVYYVNPIMYQRALADCLNQGVDVVNLSIGGPAPPDFAERTLFEALIRNGTIVVAAMGNERRFGSPTSYPAAIPGVIAVGATNIDDKVASFSNRGSHVAVSAPGVAIWSTLPTYPGQLGFDAVLDPSGNPVEGRPQRRETDYDAWPGTSMATPHVAAAAALTIANHGTHTGRDFRDRLKDTVDKVPGMNGADFDTDYGWGRLNLLRLLS